MTRDLYELGELPPPGEVPRQMYAALIRQERYGMPQNAIKVEVVDVPPLGPGQVLVLVMAAGINYNGIWAGLGTPVDVIAARQRKGDPHDFHIAGSEGSGVVWATGEGATRFQVGEHVVFGGLKWDEQADDIRLGADPTTSKSQAAWGYELNFGTFAQFTVVDEYQLHPKPERLTWEEAGCFLAGGGTAYRQLRGWAPHTVQPGDPVLVWGGSGSLGSMAIQIVHQFGGVPIAVVSSQEKAEHCRRLGARGVINRSEFDHWGRLPDCTDTTAYNDWLDGVRAFGRSFWDALGERRSPRIVLEHPGQDTLPTSLYLCDNGGMVVTCAGTSGYNGDVDLRYLWMFQKRLQGSHCANTQEFRAVTELVAAGRLDPCLSRTAPFTDIAELHQLMYDNAHPPGNMAVLVNAAEPGTTGLPGGGAK
ncbi:crotonyl-CoA carboxylase/reductase [Streptomyces pactum]|nr:crotonyl-CoA carboxylase/reductase [Streptomyces pactum]